MWKPHRLDLLIAKLIVLSQVSKSFVDNENQNALVISSFHAAQNMIYIFNQGFLIRFQWMNIKVRGGLQFQ